MVKSLRFIGYTLFFIMSLMYMLPKVNAYYALEHEGEKYKVINSGEKPVDNGFSLSVKNSNIFYDSIEVATAENLDIRLLGIYNTIDVENVKLSTFVSSFVPINIAEIHIKYSIFNPLNITADSTGAFGVAHANVSLLDRNVTVELQPSKVMLRQYKTSLQKFKKNKEGVYFYEKTF